MSDVHLRILRAAAKLRARQLRDDHPTPDERGDAAEQRHVDLERRASRAQDQLAAASARRTRGGE